MTDVQYQKITKEDEGQRLDNYLIRTLKGLPKSCIYRIIRSGEVRVNKKRAQASTRLLAGDSLRIPPLRLAKPEAVYVGEQLELMLQNCLIFEDNQIMVVNKPAGLAVHGGSGLSLGLIEAYRKMRPELTYLELVHRLDKETSGCLLFAKKRSVLRTLQQLFRERNITKTYWALLANPWKGPGECVVEAALEKNTLQSGERMVRVSSQGKPSTTSFKLLENFKEVCLIEATPKTGRTHQIRVHSAHLGHPVLGDVKYGKLALSVNLTKAVARLYLHARALQFTLNGLSHHYEACLDERFTKTLDSLRLCPKL